MSTSPPFAAKAALLAVFCAAFAVTGAAQRGAVARVTRAIKDVKILDGQAQWAATPHSAVPRGAVVRTADSSRAELVVGDRFVTRLAANTFLSLGRNDVALNQGAILFEAPAGARNAKVQVGDITVDVAGTTGMIERYGRTYAKILLLQGKARVYVSGKVGESVLVDQGQILITKPGAKSLPEPVDFNIAQLYETSVLTNADFAALPSKPLIDRAIEAQRKNPNLNPTNLVIYGRGTLVNLVEPADSDVPSPEVTPTPRPKKASPWKR